MFNKIYSSYEFISPHSTENVSESIWAWIYIYNFRRSEIGVIVIVYRRCLVYIFMYAVQYLILTGTCWELSSAKEERNISELRKYDKIMQFVYLSLKSKKSEGVWNKAKTQMSLRCLHVILYLV